MELTCLIILSLITSLFHLIFKIRKENSKNFRFKNFKNLYPDEPFEKLSEYEEKSKIKISLFELKKKINDG